MSQTRIDSALATVAVEPTRERQTQRPATPFRDVLAGSLRVLMTGAEAATGIVAGPVLAAAVRGAPAAPLPGVVGIPSGDGVALSTAAAIGNGNPVSEVATMQAMQRESQAFNLQLISLQEDIQKESRHFNTVSNVLRAKHDTAKAAISNIRS